MWDACGLLPGQPNKEELDCTSPRQTHTHTPANPTPKLLYILVCSPFGLSGCFHIESAQEGVFPRKMCSISTPVPDSVLEVSLPSATQGSRHRALSVPGDSRLPTSGESLPL